jgi:hypothetical protein
MRRRQSTFARTHKAPAQAPARFRSKSVVYGTGPSSPQPGAGGLPPGSPLAAFAGQLHPDLARLGSPLLGVGGGGSGSRPGSAAGHRPSTAGGMGMGLGSPMASGTALPTVLNNCIAYDPSIVSPKEYKQALVCHNCENNLSTFWCVLLSPCCSCLVCS